MLDMVAAGVLVETVSDLGDATYAVVPTAIKWMSAHCISRGTTDVLSHAHMKNAARNDALALMMQLPRAGH